jgi:hypothetical protein
LLLSALVFRSFFWGYCEIGVDGVEAICREQTFPNPFPNRKHGPYNDEMIALRLEIKITKMMKFK